MMIEVVIFGAVVLLCIGGLVVLVLQAIDCISLLQYGRLREEMPQQDKEPLHGRNTASGSPPHADDMAWVPGKEDGRPRPHDYVKR